VEILVTVSPHAWKKIFVKRNFVRQPAFEAVFNKKMVARNFDQNIHRL